METLNLGQIVIFSAYALIAAASFLVARMLVEEQESRAAQENLADLRDRKSSDVFVKYLRPFFTQYIVPMVRGKPFWNTRRTDYRRKLIAAGVSDELTPDEYLSFRLILVIFFPLVGGILNAGDFIDAPWWAILGSGIGGWMYPDFWLNGRIRQRQKLILRAFPFIVDLLALSTEAGLDFVGAIGKVVEKAKPSPLVEEFAQLLKEIKVGSSRQEGLRELALRIAMPQINSFVAILISADQMGASIGKILRQQSEQVRIERILRAEKEGEKASQLIMLPTVMFVMPALFIMIFGPLAFQGGLQ